MMMNIFVVKGTIVSLIVVAGIVCTHFSMAGWHCPRTGACVAQLMPLLPLPPEGYESCTHNVSTEKLECKETSDNNATSCKLLYPADPNPCGHQYYLFYRTGETCTAYPSGNWQSGGTYGGDLPTCEATYGG